MNNSRFDAIKYGIINKYAKFNYVKEWLFFYKLNEILRNKFVLNAKFSDKMKLLISFCLAHANSIIFYNIQIPGEEIRNP